MLIFGLVSPLDSSVTFPSSSSGSHRQSAGSWKE